ncbi:MAG: nitrate reductase cytochrome c-type subunit; periplasmic nitrate reductase electron transfer subunit, partial [Sulfurospirillum sp.]
AKYKKLNHLYQGRYNCTQCHVPQANIKPAVKNTFTPDYTSESDKHKSDLIDVINEGVE